MLKREINLFIVDDDKLMTTDLKYHLEDKFGVNVHISTFINVESCLKRVNRKTNIVILDYFLDGTDGLEGLKLIKAISPKTEVIMLSSSDNEGLILELLRSGASDYIIKGQGSLKRVDRFVSAIIMEPIKKVVKIIKELKVYKFLLIMLSTFALIAGSVILLTYFNLF